MVTRMQRFSILKTIAECAWNRLPNILAEIPVTASVGKVLGEVQKLCEDVKTACQSKAGEDNSFAKELKELIDKCGGENAFRKALRQELKVERDSENPTYINAAIFLLDEADALSESEQQKLVDVIRGNIEAETSEVKKFVCAFREDYFADDYDSCDNPIEVGAGYIAFNFDDMSDHPYDEEDLQLIMDMLNKMLGRDAFCEYEGLGTDDSCGY